MEQALFLGILCACAVLGADLLRRARCPGWAVLGGAAAGILMGPAVMGRAFPSFHERAFAGGAAERRALRELGASQAAEVGLARSGGTEAEVLAQLTERHKAALAESCRLWREAQRAHRVPRTILGAVAVFLMLSGAAALAVPRSGEPISLVGSVSIGLWSAAIPGGIAFFVLRYWLGASIGDAAIVAAALAIGPWALTPIDREAADAAEVGGATLLERAGAVATALAVAVVFAALLKGSPREWMHAIPLLGAAAAWALRPVAGALRCGGAVAQRLLVPLVAALAAVEIDFLAAGAEAGIGGLLWPAVLILLLSGDGRWLGALLGAMVPGGRRGMRTMRLVLGSMAAGPTQLAVVVTAQAAQRIEPRFVIALLLGAILVDAMAPARRAVARRLVETESQVERPQR